MDIFHESFLRNYFIKNYEIFDNFVFSLKVLQPLMATAGGYVSFAHFLFLLSVVRIMKISEFTVYGGSHEKKKPVFVSANSADPDEIPYDYVGPHCLPNLGVTRI